MAVSRELLSNVAAKSPVQREKQLVQMAVTEEGMQTNLSTPALAKLGPGLLTQETPIKQPARARRFRGRDQLVKNAGSTEACEDLMSYRQSSSRTAEEDIAGNDILPCATQKVLTFESERSAIC
jgi:hypothetical protein